MCAQPVKSGVSCATLPAIKTLLFHVQKPTARTCLVDAGEHLSPDVPEARKSEDDSYYEVRVVNPPESLNQLVQQGATLGLSRAGTVRVWRYGKMIAAESNTDCDQHCARKLTEDEVFYATVYLFSIGQRWSDPDQGEE